MKIDLEGDITRKGEYIVRAEGGTEILGNHNELHKAVATCNKNGPGVFDIEQPRLRYDIRATVVDEPPPPVEPEPDPPGDPNPPIDPEPDPPTPPTGDNPFNAFYAPDFRLPPLSADPIPSVTRPPKSTGLADFIRDAVTGVYIARASDAANEGSKDQLRADYSRRQAFSADEKYYLLIDGNGVVYLYERASMRKVKALAGLAGGDCEPLWHPRKPNILRHTAYTGGPVWFELDVETGERTVLFDFTGKTPWPDAVRFWTKAEGSFDAEGRYICLMAQTQGYAMRGILCFDAVEKRIVGTMTTSQAPDHVGMSPCGRWCVVSGAQTVAWPRDFDNPSPALVIEKESFERKLGIATATAEALRADPDVLDVVDDWDEAAATQRVLYARSEHSDLGFDKDGRSVIVHAVFAAGPNEGWAVCTDLETGVHTRMVRIYDDNHGSTTVHFTAQCFLRPGVCFISSYDDFSNYSRYPADPLQPLHRKVSMHYMDGSGGRNVALIHGDKSVGNPYYHEPQFTVSRSGSCGLFASSYSKPGPSPAGQPEAYMVGLPDSVYEREAA